MKHWEKVKLGQLLKESRIESNNPDSSRRIRVKLNVGGIEKRPDTNDKKGATKYFTRKKGQFIYGRQNLHKGAFGIIPEELDGFDSSSDIPAFDVDDACYAEWIFYFFKQGNFYLSLEALAKGVGSKRIHPEQLFELYIPLPNKEEQREILKKVKVFEENYKIVSEEINTQRSLFISLRQSILTEAVQGKLTAQWRKENPNQEHASVLLHRISSERAQLIKEKKISKDTPLPEIKKEEEPYEVPEGWVWCYLQDLCPNISSGSTPPSQQWKESGIPYLKVYNIRNQKIDFSYKEQFIDPVYHSTKSKRSILRPGDVIMNIVGPPLGKVAIIPDLYDEWNCNQAISFFKPIVYELNEWIYSFLCEGSFLKNIELIGTAGQDNISITKCKNIKLPIPPLTEQHAIVRKVNNLMAYYDELEQQVQQSKADLDLLMQSVLSEVFGTENQAISNKATKNKLSEKETLMTSEINHTIYNKNALNMELEDILLQNGGKMTAFNLWKMSKYQKDIDAFYEALKKEVEETKSIRESPEKGYIELNTIELDLL